MRQYKDIDGVELKVGDRVVKASRSGNSGHLEIRTVSKITEKGLYLNGANRPVLYLELIAKLPNQ